MEPENAVLNRREKKSGRCCYCESKKERNSRYTYVLARDAESVWSTSNVVRSVLEEL